MQLNADLSTAAVVEAERQPWVSSPLPGVDRRMLERDGDEVARVTSLVRYAPGSCFSEHVHHGGEEFLVLQGVFADEHGDFPAGSYVRNPVGSKHSPLTQEGCLIFVKLWWMHPADQAQVRIHTDSRARWQTADLGVETLELHRHREETNAIFRLAPGASIPAREVPGGEEVFVVEGSCSSGGRLWPMHTWARNPIGHAEIITAREGCRLYVKRGHLGNPPPAPPRTASR